MQPDDSSNLLSKACRNNSWSAWISCMLGFLAAAIEAEDGWWWYNPLGLPPEPKPTGWLCLWGAITTVKKNKRKIKETLPPPNARWCKMIKKCGSSSFVKTKEQQWQKISRSGETPPTPHFTQRFVKFLLFYIRHWRNSDLTLSTRNRLSSWWGRLTDLKCAKQENSLWQADC